MLKKSTGSYDEYGRRLDKVPAPPEDEPRAITTMTGSPAVQQQIYLTASPLFDFAPSSSRYILRVSWLQPAVVTYEYVYIYDHEPPPVGSEAGDNYFNWARVYWYDANNKDQEASYLFWDGGPVGNLDTLNGFWAAYVQYVNGKYVIAARAKFQAEKPNWMGNVYRDRPAWGNLQLNQIFLPGTHDSGTFDMVDRGIPNNYNQTQTLNFTRMLNAGVRWLDIRMGYYPSFETGKEGPFFTVHSTYGSWTAWKTALSDIAKWMAATPTEIVFINFKWEGPTSSKVRIVKNANGEDEWVWEESLKTRVLKESYEALKQFGVLPRGRHATITVKEMIQAPYRVVLATPSTYDPLGVGPDPICPGADYDWFDKYYIKELLPELTQSLSEPRTWMWAAGTVLTPHKYDGTIPWGVYALTTDAIDYMNRWIRVNANRLNVVPVDFIETNVTLALVEEFNKARA